ncbi:desulfoferrodoxin [Clostridium tepidiprofundi DSM 19306]|uniref:Desulfoferrodoxin n=1 Tax=Clostridium tepidiprofundi DSM 19306 TaxID=1121338 RepID=A0A151B284_9CLOT|nr:desulfoferrodoxin [Clostridium tepidiprofundi]KYH34031.1 desulfoferrodoxin [Clostridium tepidiprofundi DSM 19306]
MAKKLGIYKCEKCGNIVEVIIEGKAPLFCCGEKMTYLKEQTAENSVEKHVPYIEKIQGGYRVSVGKETLHPMLEKHYIQWIELIVGDSVYRKYLYPGDEPKAEFMLEREENENVYAREYCNIHGHWES